MKKYIGIVLLIFFCTSSLKTQNEYKYSWLNDNTDCEHDTIIDIPLPEGYHRIEYEPYSFQEWLRHLPLQKNHDVYLFNKTLKLNQDAHYKIINIDVGVENLQQCADAIIRLYAEYLYAYERYDAIAFNFTSGHRADFNAWADGHRPIISGNNVSWTKSAEYDLSYNNFRKYLDTIFMYAGSYSLSKELVDIENHDLQVGDIFIQGGFPGHAVIVVDMAFDPSTDNKILMIAQSYMPAQEVHILKNPQNETLSPWYGLKATELLVTPEWTFEWTDIKRFQYQESIH